MEKPSRKTSLVMGENGFVAVTQAELSEANRAVVMTTPNHRRFTLAERDGVHSVPEAAGQAALSGAHAETTTSPSKLRLTQ